MLKKPEPLRPGDRIGIIAPSSPIREPFRSAGRRAIRELGFIPVEAANIESSQGLIAKPAQAAFNDWIKFLHENEIKAVWAARGGYGSNAMLDLLSAEPDLPLKAFIASSDACYLLWRVLDYFRQVVFFGPMAYAGLAEGNFNADNLRDVLSGNHADLFIPGSIVRPGRFRGIITGGCLSILISTMGTPYCPKLAGRALILEDQNEKPHRLERMIWQLAQSKILQKAGAVLLGEFPGCFRDHREKQSFQEYLLQCLPDKAIPVLSDLPLGHAKRALTLPLGIHIEVNTDLKAGFTLLEKGVAS